MIAHWIGPAPRYFGKKRPVDIDATGCAEDRESRRQDAAERRDRDQVRLAIRATLRETRDLSFLVGWSNGKAARVGDELDRRRREFTLPRPLGLSGWVTTPTTGRSDLQQGLERRRRRKSGVPMKTIRMQLALSFCRRRKQDELGASLTCRFLRFVRVRSRGGAAW